MNGRQITTRVKSENTGCSQKSLPLTMIFEMSSRLTHEHLDFPSSATKRKGPCTCPLIRPFSFSITKQRIDYMIREERTRDPQTLEKWRQRRYIAEEIGSQVIYKRRGGNKVQHCIQKEYSGSIP